MADALNLLHLSDIKLPEGVEITDLVADPPRDNAAVSIHIPRVIEEPEEDEGEGEEAAGEEGEQAEAKGDAPAEDSGGDGDKSD